MTESPIISRIRVLDGAKFAVDRVKLRTNVDDAVPREVIVHNGAALILPLLDDGRVVLIRNYRFCVDQTLWELPCGTLEPGEDPAACAARELIEESGYQAAEISPLIRFYTTPGMCTEIMHLHLARGLTHVGQQVEDTEQIEVEPRSWAEIDAMIADGRIVDGKTLTALLYYRHVASHPPEAASGAS